MLGLGFPTLRAFPHLGMQKIRNLHSQNTTLLLSVVVGLMVMDPSGGSRNFFKVVTKKF